MKSGGISLALAPFLIVVPYVRGLLGVVKRIMTGGWSVDERTSLEETSDSPSMKSKIVTNKKSPIEKIDN